MSFTNPALAIVNPGYKNLRLTDFKDGTSEVSNFHDIKMTTDSTLDYDGWTLHCRIFRNDEVVIWYIHNRAMMIEVIKSARRKNMAVASVLFESVITNDGILNWDEAKRLFQCGKIDIDEKCEKFRWGDRQIS